jgi:peptidoglycan hydrolase-like protein with peptidoglycan-binding domain
MKLIIPTLAAVAILAACSAPQPQPAVYYPASAVRHHDEDRPIDVAPTAAQVSRGDYWKSIQTQLYAKGYYGGRIDGVDGPATRGAVRRYQHDLGVPVTGRVGDREWSALGLSSGDPGKTSAVAPPAQGQRRLEWVYPPK